MSGSRLSGKRVNETMPKMTIATVNIETLTGRRMQKSTRRVMTRDVYRVKTSTVSPSSSAVWPATMTRSPAETPLTTSMAPPRV